MVKDRLGGSGRAPAARQDLERVGFEVPGSCATVELKGQQLRMTHLRTQDRSAILRPKVGHALLLAFELDSGA